MKYFRYSSIYLLSIFISAFIIIGCTNNPNSLLANKPNAMGRVNSLVVLAEQAIWDGKPGDTLDYYFAGAYPVLPAPEPFFDLKHFTAEDLDAEPLRREFRNILVLADVSDTLSLVTKMLKRDLGDEKFKRALTDPDFHATVGVNKWARGQIMMYIFGNGEEDLANAIKSNFPGFAKRIHKNDEPALSASIYGSMQINENLSRLVRDSFGIKINIPGPYVKAIQDENFLWIRADFKEVNQSLVFRKFTYQNESQLTKANIIRLRNEYGKQYIRTSSADAYMTTNEVDLPVYEYVQPINDIYAVEVRGIWETENDFMGGPFISYALLNEKKNEIVFIRSSIYFSPVLNLNFCLTFSHINSIVSIHML